MKVGDKVRLKKSGPRTTKTARVVQFYSDIKGGVKLDRPINNFVSWNIKDLAVIKNK